MSPSALGPFVLVEASFLGLKTKRPGQAHPPRTFWRRRSPYGDRRDSTHARRCAGVHAQLCACRVVVAVKSAQCGNFKSARFLLRLLIDIIYSLRICMEFSQGLGEEWRTACGCSACRGKQQSPVTDRANVRSIAVSPQKMPKLLKVRMPTVILALRAP